MSINIDAYAHHLDAPREVNVLLSDRTMQTWDPRHLEIRKGGDTLEGKF
jgi:hypothetical protein